MTGPVVTEAGSVPMGDDFDVVAFRLDERVAGPIVVRRGHGEPLARLLSSGPIIKAARDVVELYANDLRQVSTLDQVTRVLEGLVEAVAAVEGTPLGTGPLLEPPAGAELVMANPTQTLVGAANRLLYGNEEGKESDFKSPFKAIAIAGVVTMSTPFGPSPQPFACVLGNADNVEAMVPLGEQLREMAGDILEQSEAYRVAFGTKKESEPSS